MSGESLQPENIETQEAHRSLSAHEFSRALAQARAEYTGNPDAAEQFVGQPVDDETVNAFMHSNYANFLNETTYDHGDGEKAWQVTDVSDLAEKGPNGEITRTAMINLKNENESIVVPVKEFLTKQVAASKASQVEVEEESNTFDTEQEAGRTEASFVASLDDMIRNPNALRTILESPSTAFDVAASAAQEQGIEITIELTNAILQRQQEAFREIALPAAIAKLAKETSKKVGSDVYELLQSANNRLRDRFGDGSEALLRIRNMNELDGQLEQAQSVLYQIDSNKDDPYWTREGGLATAARRLQEFAYEYPRLRQFMMSDSDEKLTGMQSAQNRTEEAHQETRRHIANFGTASAEIDAAPQAAVYDEIEADVANANGITASEFNVKKTQESQQTATEIAEADDAVKSVAEKLADAAAISQSHNIAQNLPHDNELQVAIETIGRAGSEWGNVTRYQLEEAIDVLRHNLSLIRNNLEDLKASDQQDRMRVDDIRDGISKLFNTELVQNSL